MATSKKSYFALYCSLERPAKYELSLVMIIPTVCKIIRSGDKQENLYQETNNTRVNKVSQQISWLFTPGKETGHALRSNEKKTPCVVSKIMIKTERQRRKLWPDNLPFTQDLLSAGKVTRVSPETWEERTRYDDLRVHKPGSYFEASKDTKLSSNLKR